MSSEHTPAGRASEATPGPWKWDGWDNDRGSAKDGFQTLDGGPGGRGIGAVLSIEDYGSRGGIEYAAYRISVTEANATLIARAPLLRDALRELLAANGPLTGSGVRRERAEEQAKAALEGL